LRAIVELGFMQFGAWPAAGASLVGEFSAEFVADAPCQLALARVVGREDDGEVRRNFEIFTFTPPFDTSVIVQSRGNDPAPHWIFAILLHTRRSLFRRSADI
jgi:hypothetical protein